jgi:hypothetical protein
LVDFLQLAEFTYNNTIHAPMKVFPFFANYGFYPRFSISILVSSVNPSAESRAHTLQEVHHDLSLELSISNDGYKDHANRLRSATTAFVVGDMVWLLRRHNATTHPCSKLDYKKLGPFHIIERINPAAFRPDLPQYFGIHNVFHASILKIYHSSQIPGQQPSPPPPVELSSGEGYEVEQILDSCVNRQQLQYLFLWKGYPLSKATWELVIHLKNAPEAIH